ncbi:MAG: hypothetical protein WC829_02865 [Hyphomicrobium sp.]|jgi:hypothetical protein
MSQKVVKAFSRLGDLDTNSNIVERNGVGAREMVGVADLDNDGAVSLLPGYSKLLNAPMYADYTTGSVGVSNGSKFVVMYNTELVTNGDMSSATGWTFTGSAGVKWDIAGGVATRVANAADLALVSAFAPTNAVTYFVRYTIIRTAGTLTVSMGGVSRAFNTSVIYVDVVLAGSTAALTFTADATFAGTVDNVSVQVAAPINRGDLLIGPDGKYYEIADYTGADITLTTEYEGATAYGVAGTIRHKVWMLAPFYATAGDTSATKTKSFVSTTGGTFTGTESGANGVYLSTAEYAGKIPDGSMSDYLIASGSGARRFADRFVPSATVSNVKGIWLDIAEYSSTADTFKIEIWDNNGSGRPGSVLYTTGTLTWSTQIAKTTESRYYFPFTATAGFTIATTYFVVVTAVSGSTVVRYAADWTAAGTMSNVGSHFYYDGNFWRQLDPEFSPSYAFINYPTTAKTYVSETFDMGGTPAGSSSLTISVPTPSNDLFYTNKWSPTLAIASGDANTMTYEVERSSDGSSWTSVASGLTALNYTIAANYRYFRVTFSLTSATNETSPTVTSATIISPLSLVLANESNLREIVGCGKYIFSSIAATAATINSTSVPGVRPAAWCIYNNDFFYRLAYHQLRHWDAIGAADAAVASMLKTDGSAGTDPPNSSYCIVAHNDKLICGGNVGVLFHTGTATDLTETLLTDSGAAFTTTTTTATGMIGWKLNPNLSWTPIQLFNVTSNDATSATCSSSHLITNGHGNGAATFSTYNIYKFYPKTMWYTDEAEPAHWPTTNLLYFSAADGDYIQQLVSHNGNLLIICTSQVWLVSGYGPSTPWSKVMLSKSGGVIAPMSVVSDSQHVYWWSDAGIVRSASGQSAPEIIDSRIRDITINAINAEMKHNIVGARHKERLYWSYPSASSNINDTTIVYDPSTGRWAKYDLGMYCPTSVLETDGSSVLKFWEPTSGCMCKLEEDVYTYAGTAKEFTYATSFMYPSAPSERSQFLELRAIIKANETLPITMSAAYDYSDSYAVVGTLTPLTTAVSTRTSANATDTVYFGKFLTGSKGTAVSVKLTGSPASAFKILQLDVIADAEEFLTKR